MTTGLFRLLFLLAVIALASDRFSLFSSASTSTSTSPRVLQPDEMASAKKSCLLLVADGSEDMEAVITSDILTRAGFNVVIASVWAKSSDGVVALANGVRLVPDKKLSEVKNEAFDVVVLPGGMPGAEHLRDSTDVKEVLNAQDSQKKWIAAICASPKVVLQEIGILGDRKATGYPKFQPDNFAEGNVVVSENIITSRGPGTAAEFALTIVENVLEAGAEVRKKLEVQLLLREK